MATIITTVSAAVIIAAIFAAIKNRSLYVISPKLYLNTPISAGQIISLDLYNAGLLSEEDVALTMRPACKFELIATSKSTLTVNKNVISVAKLSRLEKVAILLLVEDKLFSKFDIESVESKHVKGKVVEDKDGAIPLIHRIMAIPIILLLFIIPFQFGTVVGAENKISAFELLDGYFEIFGRSIQLSGYGSTSHEGYGTGKLQNAVRDGKVNIQVSEIVRHRNSYKITLDISNRLDIPILVSGYVESSAGDGGAFSFGSSVIRKFALSPNQKISETENIIIPDDVKTKIVEYNISLNAMNGDYSHVTQYIRLDRN